MQKINGSKVDEVYSSFKKALYFHGTSRESAEDIKAHGMKFSMKKEGSSEIFKRKFDMGDAASATHHYVMTFSKACAYAKMFKDPAIVRMILPKSKFILEEDPESALDGEEFRVNSNISKNYILCKSGKGLKDRLQLIAKAMGFPELEKKELRELKKRVVKNFMGTPRSDRGEISKAYSYVAGEEKRIERDFKKMRNLGIDLGALKPGDVVSLPVDEDEI